jgi:hypothetical protein
MDRLRTCEELCYAARRFQYTEIWKTQRLKITDGPWESRPHSHTRKTQALRSHLAALKRLANTHPKCVTIPALRDISSQIDVVLLT